MGRLGGPPRSADNADGSATKGKAGWASIVYLGVNQELAMLYAEWGPVVVNKDHAEFCGAEDLTNNTAEGTARYKSHTWAVLRLPPSWPQVIRFDSTLAQDVSSGRYLSRTSRELTALPPPHQQLRCGIACSRALGGER